MTEAPCIQSKTISCQVVEAKVDEEEKDVVLYNDRSSTAVGGFSSIDVQNKQLQEQEAKHFPENQPRDSGFNGRSPWNDSGEPPCQFLCVFLKLCALFQDHLVHANAWVRSMCAYTHLTISCCKSVFKKFGGYLLVRWTLAKNFFMIFTLSLISTCKWCCSYRYLCWWARHMQK